MLHLQAGVHFQEVEIAVLVDEELDRTSTFIATGQRRLHGSFAHGLAQFGCYKRRGCLFDDFLMAPLN